jgi:hypothetical protein
MTTYNNIYYESVEQLLSAIYASGQTYLTSFIYEKPGKSLHSARMGTELHVKRREYLRAVLFIRKHGPSHLRVMSVPDLHSLVTNFIRDNYWLISAGEFSRDHKRSYAEQIDTKSKSDLADALRDSLLFNPINKLTLFPLTAILIKDKFVCPSFFLMSPNDITIDQSPLGIQSPKIEPTHFPPVLESNVLRQPCESWLGVHSPLIQISSKRKSAILGAIALTPTLWRRYIFSGRPVMGGWCTLTKSEYTTSASGDPHIPPLMNNLVLTEADHKWLKILSELFENVDIQARKQVKALEYFYRAWFLDSHERFPLLCMALDSLVGAARRHTSEAVDFVKRTIETPIDKNRLVLLMKIRGAVIHGAAPDVYDSEHYAAYYATYEIDPLRDIELIVAECLRKNIFQDVLGPHIVPDAEKTQSQNSSAQDYIISPILH